MTPAAAGVLTAGQLALTCNFSLKPRRGCAQGKESAFQRRTRKVVEPSTTPMEPSTTLIHPRARAAQELVLGRYRLLERLGAGGFGVVWRAHDEQLGREVALKRIPLPSKEDSERATREALATARLSHPAIVALYEACADGDAFYLISELVYGETLAQLIAHDELRDEEIVEIGVAIAQALEHAHARGVIHRDVKPQNVLVLEQPHERAAIAKLADFGGACMAGEDALTRTGDVLGTLAYMAPEQSEGRELGAPVDVYSLGLVLYEALSGVNPVRGSTPAATARRIGHPIEPLERRRGDLRRELTRGIDAALDPHPRQRATLAELKAALEEGLEGGLRGGRVVRRGGIARRGGVALEMGRTEEPSQEPAHASPDPPALVERRSPGQAAAVGPPQAPQPGHLDQLSPEPPLRSRRFAMPRLVWLAVLVGLSAWQGALGMPGVSLLVLAAGAPLLVPRRWGLGWLLAGWAPALGMLGLAGAYPALAGQGSHWRERAGMAALGFWWMTLAEPLLGTRLWEGPPTGLPARAVWEGSLRLTATHVIASSVTVGLLIGMLVWAGAAAILPWIVRGRSAALDVAAALTWTVALLWTVPLLERGAIAHTTHPSPRGALLGAVLGCMLAVCARALRGPVCP
jgi:eukaryotic-like serine/threonine-protein kinase